MIQAELEAIANRLRLFVLKRNRRAKIQRISGVSMNTLFRFLSGEDIRLNTLIKIEKACLQIQADMEDL
jgi:predicted transcriptional regulator